MNMTNLILIGLFGVVVGYYAFHDYLEYKKEMRELDNELESEGNPSVFFLDTDESPKNGN